ncbi:4'-phosphopantetheinyl transferase superfamily protein [bacterium]|nr:4'-phosphopantetheinyl transferase superfamily protein [bacterium]
MFRAGSNDFNKLPSWYPPPEPLTLGKNEVHVWRASLDLPAAQAQSLQHTLATEELRRAERYYFQKDRKHFIVARGLLRDILGRYLKMEPGLLRFCYNPYGKPGLAGDTGGETLCFNVSHSHGLALYAVTRDRAVGVDVEFIRPDLATEDIAERFFSPREVAVFRALSANMKPEAFFNCWTRKEAYIKARGKGLSIPLDQFDVSLAPGEPAALLSVNGEPQEASRWLLQELDVGSGYAAALAAEDHYWQLKCWQWSVLAKVRVKHRSKNAIK